MADPVLIGILLLAMYVLDLPPDKERTNPSPVDIIISLAWFAAFGVLVDTIRQLPCGSIWSWHFRGDQTCGRWKAAEAFSFLSAILWLVSGIVVCDEILLLYIDQIANQPPGHLVHLPRPPKHHRWNVSNQYTYIHNTILFY